MVRLSLMFSYYPHSSLFIKPPTTTQTYTLSLHDALPIYRLRRRVGRRVLRSPAVRRWARVGPEDDASRTHHLPEDRKSTRLNSSHVEISYAVFCLKKKIDILKTLVTNNNKIFTYDLSLSK